MEVPQSRRRGGPGVHGPGVYLVYAVPTDPAKRPPNPPKAGDRPLIPR